jgi:hypothetical protein
MGPGRLTGRSQGSPHAPSSCPRRRQIVRISDTARVTDRDKVGVEATYKCWGKGRDITTTVILTQRSGGRYDASVKGDLRCDGNRHTQAVKLDRDSRDRVRNGEAKVTCEYSAGRTSLDREYARVDVRGAGKGHY